VIALQKLAAELAITVTAGDVWFAIAQGLLVGAVCLLFGIWAARRVGLLSPGAPAGESIGVGLATGLMVLAAWWAAIWSGGRSSFTPVAVGFAVAIVVSLATRSRRPAPAEAAVSGTIAGPEEAPSRWTRDRGIVLGALAGGVFVVAVALLYGATMAPSPRDGVQPVENRDEAYYAVLGRDLASTGIETNMSPSGFSDLPALPVQLWYHWGELWLASAAVTILGSPAIAARFFIVLPLALLAAAALSGTLVRRMAGTDSRRAYLFGFVACLFLAPVPLIPGPFFSSWAVGMIFGITLYGLGAVAGLLAIYHVVVLGGRPASWGLAAFVGSATAFIIPAHIAIAVLAFVGVAIVAMLGLGRTAAARRLPVVPPVWSQTLIAAAVAVIATVVWGIVTGHSLGGGGASADTVVDPFNASWRDSVAITILGAGLLLAIPVGWFLARKDSPLHADLYVATIGLLAAGAIGWGARLGDFTMFYLYFAGIAVFATALAAVAVRTLWDRLRGSGRRWLAAGLIAACLLQLELGVAGGLARLQGFGPGADGPIAVSLLEAIEGLPADARLAYTCEPFGEVAFGTPQLLSIDAHTGRRVVPMCFEAEFPSTLVGAQQSLQVPSQFFRGAPQASLYPDAEAAPSSADVVAFLKRHGIDYIYADGRHPNTLVPDALSIATSGHGEVLQVPEDR
jgi:hypothetical protein